MHATHVPPLLYCPGLHETCATHAVDCGLGTCGQLQYTGIAVPPAQMAPPLHARQTPVSSHWPAGHEVAGATHVDALGMDGTVPVAHVRAWPLRQ